MFSIDTIIVTELAESNLYEFIQFHRYNSCIMKWSLQILWQISSALEFVADNEMIHRDIACRNILMFNKNVAKLADFGLCTKMETNGIFKDTTHKKFPLKWLSIEALNDRIFSEKSDVWAFGVTCFEIFSHGDIPYSLIPHKEMVEYLESGKRLPKPENVAPHIYELMCSCWIKESQDRPSFKEIRKSLEAVLEYGYLSLQKTA
uniref:receptor protein-tyrosine kinase n=1 Tax=Panagrolaimus davidi TaxID=227884 RepID=A0A914PV06_9BILA